MEEFWNLDLGFVFLCVLDLSQFGFFEKSGVICSFLGFRDM